MDSIFFVFLSPQEKNHQKVYLKITLHKLSFAPDSKQSHSEMCPDMAVVLVTVMISLYTFMTSTLVLTSVSLFAKPIDA